jgi:hypothetical protein
LKISPPTGSSSILDRFYSFNLMRFRSVISINRLCSWFDSSIYLIFDPASVGVISGSIVFKSGWKQIPNIDITIQLLNPFSAKGTSNISFIPRNFKESDMPPTKSGFERFNQGQEAVRVNCWFLTWNSWSTSCS